MMAIPSDGDGGEESTGGNSRKERTLSSPLITVLTKICWAVKAVGSATRGATSKWFRQVVAPGWSAPGPRRQQRVLQDTVHEPSSLRQKRPERPTYVSALYLCQPTQLSTVSNQHRVHYTLSLAERQLTRSPFSRSLRQCRKPPNTSRLDVFEFSNKFGPDPPLQSLTI